MSKLFLVAEIAGRTVAVGTDQVEAAVDLGDIVAVPCAPESVRGLAALRSRVVTVIDTALALGLPPMPATARRAVTARIDGHDYGFLVETLEDVALFEPLPLATGLRVADGWQAAAVAMIDREGDPVVVIDLAALVPILAVAA